MKMSENTPNKADFYGAIFLVLFIASLGVVVLIQSFQIQTLPSENIILKAATDDLYGKMADFFFESRLWNNPLTNNIPVVD